MAPFTSEKLDEASVSLHAVSGMARIAAGSLVLDRYRAAHARVVWEAIETSRARLQHWVPEIAAMRDIGQVQAGLAQLEDAWHKRRKYVYAILARSNNRFLGEVGLYGIDWSRRTGTVGVWLSAAAEGHGYASAALTALAHAADRHLGLETLNARVHPKNERSQRLMKRCGFVLVGTSPAFRSFEGDSETVLVYRRAAAAGLE
jgi:RimJ/RimL family protein N-acetyltransferase